MNMIDDCNVYIRDYCRMSLHLAKKVLNMKISLKAIEKDVPEIMVEGIKFTIGL